MKKNVVLLTENGSEIAPNVAETLRSAGFIFSCQDLADAEDSEQLTSREPAPVALIFQLPAQIDIEHLRHVADLASEYWPGVPLVTVTNAKLRTAAKLDQPMLMRAGVRAVAENAAQLPAVLREVEENPTAGDLLSPEEFKSLPDPSIVFPPKGARAQLLRDAYSLISTLHFAATQKEAALAAIAGMGWLVPADRWTIFIAGEDLTAGPRLDALIGREFPEPNPALFADYWQQALRDFGQFSPGPPTKISQQAAARFELIKRTVQEEWIAALPLVAEDRVVGVLEGSRHRSRHRTFSRSERALLSALAGPIAAALSNSARVADAERLSLTDELTRLHNARYLRQFLVNEIKRARRYHSNVAALFFDLDDFKRINDMHGHLAGSHVLMEVAAVVLPSVRDTDCVVRYGGDEFVVILPETGVDEAVRVADRIRMKIEKHPFTGGRRLTVSLTASIGVAVFPEDALSPHQLIACADRAMYAAKAASKNCVRVAEAIGPVAGAAQEPEPMDGTQFQRIPGENFIS
jgi:diguanylate cyclase (GGDEF)-like protein